MKVDLHCHTNLSDGELTPTALIDRAIENGVDMLSITDHDTIAAYQHLDEQKKQALKLIPGIEFSTQWNGIGIHILGYNFDLNSKIMAEGIAAQAQARAERSEIICKKLIKIGLNIDLTRVQEIANNGNLGRPHFAKHLIEIGAVKDFRQAFDIYLGDGKPGDVKQFWAPLPQIIEWITASGGDAVIAHPRKYKMTRSKLIRLVDDFKAAGGIGIEVVSGLQTDEETSLVARICIEKELLASSGSDFHQPNIAWRELGKVSAMPDSCTTIWQNW